ncbi:MAG TPA: hypothetical protein VFD70_21370 [Anaerolineae bacterium]|nr:hypothetical protein [Anaerolineae bacterium]
MKRAFFCLVLAAWFALTAVPSAVHADAPVKERQFVWGVLASTGHDYNGVFSPGVAPSLYLLAGQTHILLPSYTLVYYWPIDHEYKPDWASLNEPAAGTVEILTLDGRVLQRLTSETYLMQPVNTPPGSPPELLRGEQATAAYHAYETKREAYYASMAEYDKKLAEYMRQQELTPNDTFLQKPDPPPTFAEFFPPPSPGYFVQLDPGAYRLQLRDASGQIVPGSQRTLIAVTPRQESVGYAVIPESKWTIPEQSDESSEIIYVTAQGTTLYLEPFRMREFNQQELARLSNPQDTTASPNRWQWVQDAPLNNVQLEILSNGQPVARVAKQSYSVKQIPGAALGYTVVPFDASATASPDLEAFAVPAVAGATAYAVRLVYEDGIIVPGSERSVIQANDTLSPFSYALIFLPLGGGLVVLGWRRRIHARSLKALAAMGG